MDPMPSTPPVQNPNPSGSIPNQTQPVTPQPIPEHKSHTQIIVIIILVIVILIVLGLVYRGFKKSTAGGASIQNPNSYSSAVSTPAPNTASLNSGDPTIDQDSNAINTSLNNVNSSLNGVDQGLSDQPGDLSVQ